MNEAEIRALFLLSYLDIKGCINTAPNPYWMDRRPDAGPQWIVPTKAGDVKVHRRKRVIEINWEETILSFPLKDQYGRSDIHSDLQLTPDDVTKGATMVHADSNAKCVEYLSLLRAAFERAIYINDFALRKANNALSEEERRHLAYFQGECKELRS